MYSKINFKQSNSKGFSLIEALIATSLISVFVVSIPTFWSMARKSEAFLRLGQNAYFLKKDISISLSDPESCRRTLAGKKAQESISEIFHATTTAVLPSYLKGQTYFESKVKIEKMDLSRLVAPLEQKGTGLYSLTLEFSGMMPMQLSSTRRILLNARYDNDDKIVSCQTDLEQLGAMACDSYGGVVIPQSDGSLKCSEPIFQGATTSVSQDVVSKGGAIHAAISARASATEAAILSVISESKSEDLFTKSFNSAYVKLASTARAPEFIGMKKVCNKNGICRNFARTNCDSGSYVSGVDAYGNVKCLPKPNVNSCVSTGWTKASEEKCSVSCGGGQRNVNWIDNCGNTQTTSESCNTNQCQCVSSSWTKTTVSTCTVKCGTGTQEQTWVDNCGGTKVTTESCGTPAETCVKNSSVGGYVCETTKIATGWDPGKCGSGANCAQSFTWCSALFRDGTLDDSCKCNIVPLPSSEGVTPDSGYKLHSYICVDSNTSSSNYGNVCYQAP